MNFISLYILYFIAVLCIAGSTGYTVSGNKISDPNGKQILLRGVDRCSFEWSPTGEMASASDYQLMAGWGSNVVRIATNQDFWLASGSTYPETIDQQISWANAAGMGVILDLHWNNGGQQNMADRNSITYWSQVAARYKGNAWVMFELYNEPHDISLTQWLSGDSQYAGMQEMYNAVRAAGAENVCIVGGLNWAFDLSGVGQGYAVQGTNIAYSTHPYDYAGKQLADWPAAFGYLVPTYPVIITEFGQYCNNDTYNQDLLNYAQSNQISWTAWAWYVSGCSFPSLISDWSGTPISGVGQLVKSYLSGNAPSPPVGTTGPISSTTGSSTTGSSTPPPASGSMVVYSDSLSSGWQDWSWSTSYSLSDTSVSYTGTDSIRFQVMSYQGVYFHYTSSFASGTYGSVQFYVNGGSTTVPASSLGVQIYGTNAAVAGTSVPFPAPAVATQWTLISIPISNFGAGSSTQITGIAIVSNVATSAGTIYVDEISFVPAGTAATPPPTQAPTNPPTQAPTHAPTNPPTHAPTNPPTQAPTNPPTQPATHAPTNPPTQPATHAPTNPPTSAPTNPPTHSPTGCSASSIQLTQSSVSSWPYGSQTVTQYNLQISHTCAGMTLTELTLEVSNWDPVNFWNVDASTASSSGDAMLTMPSYFALTDGQTYTVGYQTAAGQACVSVAEFTFQ